MRNLFGWSSPPKRKDRKYSRLRAAALQELITGKAANQIFVDIEEHGDGYVVPLSILRFVSNDDGTVNKLDVVRRTVNTPADNSDPVVTVPDTEIWEVLQVNAFFIMAAVVVDRSCSLQFKQIQSIAATAAINSHGSVAISLQTGQHGQISVGRNSYYTGNDNGTMTNTASNSMLPMIMGAGSTITTTTTNSDAGDRHSLDVYYRLVGKDEN